MSRLTPVRPSALLASVALLLPGLALVLSTSSPASAVPTTATAQVSDSTIQFSESFTTTITLSDANGQQPTGTYDFYVFHPSDTTCSTDQIIFAGGGTWTEPQETFTYTPQTLGTHRVQVIFDGDEPDFEDVSSVCGAPGTTVEVTQGTMGIDGTSSPSAVALGESFTSTANLSKDPIQGQVWFRFYGPGDPGCTDTAEETFVVEVFDDERQVVSDPFTPTAVGTYRVTAEFRNSNGRFADVITACDDPAFEVTVTEDGPAADELAISLTLSDSAVTTGEDVTANATLTFDGPQPTGTITFSAYGPDDPDCSGEPFFETLESADQDNPIESDPFVLTDSGSYDFIASYGGDADYDPVATACGAATVTVEDGDGDGDGDGDENRDDDDDDGSRDDDDDDDGSRDDDDDDGTRDDDDDDDADAKNLPDTGGTVEARLLLVAMLSTLGGLFLLAHTRRLT